ncbi:MAG: peptidylprolyl isomerase [Bacteroidales bacterium]
MRKTHRPVYLKVKNYFKVAALSAAFVFCAEYTNAQKIKEKDVLIDLGNEKVSQNDFIDAYKENNLREGVIDKKSLNDYLDLFINFKLKVKEARSLGYDTIPSYIKEIAGYREQLAKPYFVDSDVNEELIKEAYDRTKQIVKASHILLRVKENASPEDTLKIYNKALEIREKAENGESFGDLAAEYSDDPSARDQKASGRRPAMKGNKGELGYFSAFDMVYPFESAAYNTPVGEISLPIRTRFGYHLVKIENKQPTPGIMQIAHIFVNPGVNHNDSIQAKEKINQISEKLKEGMPWNEAVKKYSEDKGSAPKNGLLPRFHANRMVAPVIEAILKLDTIQGKNISQPVQTPYGYHIIKLISKVTPSSFDKEKEKIKSRLSRDNRNLKSRNAVVLHLEKSYKYKPYSKNKEKLFTKLVADTNLVNGMIDIENYKDLSAPLYKFDKKKYPQSDFVNYLVSKQKGKINNNPIIYLDKSYKEFIEEFVLNYEDKHLEQKYPDFSKLMDKYRDGILLFNLSDDKIWSKAISDTTGLKNFYETNKNKYMWETRVNAMIFTVKDPKNVNKVRDIVSSNTDAIEIRNKVNADTTLNVKIQEGKFTKNKNAYIDEIPWKKGLSKNFEDELGNSVVFIKIMNVIEPEPKKLEEAKGIITADYQNFLEKQWIKELREKYPVMINENVFEKIEIKK